MHPAVMQVTTPVLNQAWQLQASSLVESWVDVHIRLLGGAPCLDLSPGFMEAGLFLGRTESQAMERRNPWEPIGYGYPAGAAHKW